MKLQKKVLIVTAKWPYVSQSTDGGDSTTKEIISSLSNKYIVDMLCFRNDIEMGSTIDHIHNIFFYYDDFALFKNYALHNEEKFLVRLQQSQIAGEEIRKISDNYDFIIVQHVMFLLSMDDDKELLNKIVLYPMFTGSSYLRSGEKVPDSYFKKEKSVLSLVRLIVTPSNVERDMLVDIYGVELANIIVVPRPVEYKHSTRKISDERKIRLIYIASIRIQKNHLSAMKLVKCIHDEGINVELHCVGAIQDEAIYSECKCYLKTNNLTENVIFHGNKSYEQVAGIMSKCDFNISVSKWETFGRGIYEGMVFGLPTVILDQLECIAKADNIGIYPCITSSVEEMASQVINLFHNRELYVLESKKGAELSELLNSKNIYRLIREKYNEVFGKWDAIEL